MLKILTDYTKIMPENFTKIHNKCNYARSKPERVNYARSSIIYASIASLTPNHELDIVLEYTSHINLAFIGGMGQ